MYRYFLLKSHHLLLWLRKLFSSYESHSTWKDLVGIAPNGAVTFIPFQYTGCMSDVEINKSYGLTDLLTCGDEVSTKVLY